MKRIILTAILALAALTASAQTLVVYYSKPGETYTSDGIIDLKKGNTSSDLPLCGPRHREYRLSK